MSDPTTTLGFALVPLILIALIGASFYAGRQSMLPRVREAVTMFPPVTFMVEPSAELAARDAVIAAQTGVIEVITTTQVTAPSPFTVLPAPAQVPSRVEVAVSERLALLVMELRQDLEAVIAERDYFYHLKTKHWAALKKARARIAELQPKTLYYDDFLRECELKTAYHDKARTFADRITTAREAIASEAMRDEIDSILSGSLSDFPVTRPLERIAA